MHAFLRSSSSIICFTQILSNRFPNITNLNRLGEMEISEEEAG